MQQFGEWLDIASRAGGIVATLAATGFGLLMLRLKNVFATKVELAAVKDQVEENTKAIAAIEGVLENLPDAKDVEQLRIAITELRGDIGILRVTAEGYKDALDRTTAATTRIEQFLMTKGK